MTIRPSASALLSATMLPDGKYRVVHRDRSCGTRGVDISPSQVFTRRLTCQKRPQSHRERICPCSWKAATLSHVHKYTPSHADTSSTGDPDLRIGMIARGGVPGSVGIPTSHSPLLSEGEYILGGGQRRPKSPIVRILTETRRLSNCFTSAVRIL
jgi:hypothetical protein